MQQDSVRKASVRGLIGDSVCSHLPGRGEASSQSEGTTFYGRCDASSRSEGVGTF